MKRFLVCILAFICVLAVVVTVFGETTPGTKTSAKSDETAASGKGNVSTPDWKVITASMVFIINNSEYPMKVEEVGWGKKGSFIVQGWRKKPCTHWGQDTILLRARVYKKWFIFKKTIFKTPVEEFNSPEGEIWLWNGVSFTRSSDLSKLPRRQ